MTAITVPDLLAAAADHIQTHGLTQGDFHGLGPIWWDPFTAPACTDGALWLAAGHLPNDPAAPFNVVRVITEAEELIVWQVVRDGASECFDEHEESDLVETIAGWNDSDSNDSESVVSTLRDLADSLRARDGVTELMPEIDAALLDAALSTTTRKAVAA